VVKIAVQERQLAVKLLRELSKLLMKANFQHHIVLNKSATHYNDFIILNGVTISIKSFINLKKFLFSKI